MLQGEHFTQALEAEEVLTKPHFKQGLGDVICKVMKENGRDEMTLAELVYKFSDISEIECNYHGKNYRVRFDCMEKIPKVEVHEVCTGRAWMVVLKSRVLKRVYSTLASQLSLARQKDRIGIVSDGVRGGVLSAIGVFTNKFGVGMHDTMSAKEMSEFLGERFFDPTRKSTHVEYIVM